MNSFLTNSDIVELIDLRRNLHRRPELSGEEKQTAAAIVRELKKTRPERIVTELGGHGVAAIYESGEPGPTIMFRCELDGLPIEEISPLEWRSRVPGHGHLCGHEGHMTIMVALARGLAARRPARGRAVLLFQPAEETGAGAAAVIADPKFSAIAPDFAFALHNLPGLPVAYASLSEGPANCASRGLRMVLTGKTSHASAPEDGVSPMPAIAALMPALTALGPGGPLDGNYALVTITHAALGSAAFGVAPGEGEVWATLRTLRDESMASLCEAAEQLASRVASENCLTLAMTYHDVFHHCDNDAEAVAHLREAFEAEGIRHGPAQPIRASEDFGLFGRKARSAMFWFGSGETSPQLHNPDFDFPDALIDPGSRIFMRVLRNLLG